MTYDFDRSFVIDSEGAGYWGNDATDGLIGAGDTLTMREFTSPEIHFADFDAYVQHAEPGELARLHVRRRVCPGTRHACATWARTRGHGCRASPPKLDGVTYDKEPASAGFLFHVSSPIWRLLRDSIRYSRSCAASSSASCPENVAVRWLLSLKRTTSSEMTEHLSCGQMFKLRSMMTDR